MGSSGWVLMSSIIECGGGVGRVQVQDVPGPGLGAGDRPGTKCATTTKMQQCSLAEILTFFVYSRGNFFI